MKIDHIGVVVSSIEEALPFYKNALGLLPVHREEVASQHARVCFLQAGQTAIELLEPVGQEGAVAKFIKQRGPGLHHVAFAAADIGAEMARLRALNLPPLEEAARPGARGHKVCFLHPKFAQGVLIELVGGGFPPEG